MKEFVKLELNLNIKIW